MYGTFLRGLRAGTLAGLLLVGLFFVDYGPATTLSTVARWFALDGNPWSKLIGAILLVALGGVFGGALWHCRWEAATSPFAIDTLWGDMREADMECKVAIPFLLYVAYQSALQAVLFIVTRRRKLAAETLICCQFSAQIKRAKVRIHGETSPQKSFVGRMSGSLALRNSLAHTRP